MDKIYHLYSEDIERATFNAREICDRQYSDMTIQEALEEGEFVHFSRRDMFWVGVTVGKTDIGSCCIEPDLINHDKFDVRQNWCEADYESFEKLKPRIVEFFRQSPEFQKQKEWLGKIKEKFFDPFGGYDEWVKKSRELRKVHEDNKIAFARKYADQFEKCRAGDKETEATLNEVMKTERVYRRGAGLMHLMWIYENKVLKTVET